MRSETGPVQDQSPRDWHKMLTFQEPWVTALLPKCWLESLTSNSL